LDAFGTVEGRVGFVTGLTVDRGAAVVAAAAAAVVVVVVVVVIELGAGFVFVVAVVAEDGLAGTSRYEKKINSNNNIVRLNEIFTVGFETVDDS